MLNYILGKKAVLNFKKINNKQEFQPQTSYYNSFTFLYLW